MQNVRNQYIETNTKSSAYVYTNNNHTINSLAHAHHTNTTHMHTPSQSIFFKSDMIKSYILAMR